MEEKLVEELVVVVVVLVVAVVVVEVVVDVVVEVVVEVVVVEVVVDVVVVVVNDPAATVEEVTCEKSAHPERSYDRRCEASTRPTALLVAV